MHRKMAKLPATDPINHHITRKAFHDSPILHARAPSIMEDLPLPHYARERVGEREAAMFTSRKLGWIHLPSSPLAWALFALLVAFCAQSFLAVDARSHSVSDTLYGIFPVWLPTFLLWEWIGSRTER